MKKIIACLFVFVSLSAVAQTKKTQEQMLPRPAATNTTTARTQSHTLPYDVNDKYMGRKMEFLNQMTVKELPFDFPVYQKELGWGLDEYNAVVQAYYMNHKDILKPRVLEKISYQETH
jgi:hypothetical protein